MFQRSRETRICYIVCCNAALSQMSDQLELLAESVFKTNTSLRYMVSASASSDVWISMNELNLRPGQIFAILSVCVSFLRCVDNGRRYDKCGTKLLLIVSQHKCM